MAEHHPPPSYSYRYDDPIYPVSDNVGKGGLQAHVIGTLWRLLVDYFTTLERSTLVGANQFIYYRRGEPGAHVDPDVYVIDDETTCLPPASPPSPSWSACAPSSPACAAPDPRPILRG
jgi:hypothetical protein